MVAHAGHPVCVLFLREKEKAYVDNLLNMNSKQGANYWESVCAFINFEAPAKKEKPKSKNEPVRSSVLLQEAKPGKHTDLARMRQVRSLSLDAGSIPVCSACYCRVPVSRQFFPLSKAGS